MSAIARIIAWIIAISHFSALSLPCNVTTSNTALRRTASGNPVVAQDGNIANAKVNGSFVLIGMSYGDCVFDACTNESAGACGFDGPHSRFLVWLSPTLADGSWDEPLELLPAPERPSLFDNAIFFRPHLIYNPRTTEWVLWVRWLPRLGPSLMDDPDCYFTASAPSLDSPFIVKNVNVSMYWNNSADDGLFVDGDGVGYLVHTARSTGTKIVVERLTDNFYGSLGFNDSAARSDLIGPGHTEAPAMWVANGRYYVSMSPLCCYCQSGSPTLVYSAPSPLGPYAPAGTLGNGPSAQQNFVIADPAMLHGSLWSGNRWGSDPINSPPHFDNSLQYWTMLTYDTSGYVLPLVWSNTSTFTVMECHEA